MKFLKAFLLFAVVGALFSVPFLVQANDEMAHDQITIKTASGEEFYFDVELAVSGSEHSKGLMGRTSLDEGAGMLFLFGGEAQRSFWMRDTLIPLDMLFITKDGTIHHIHSMAKPQDDSLISSKRASMAVLELNGGLSERLGIKAGDTVIHDAFRNKLAP